MKRDVDISMPERPRRILIGHTVVKALDEGAPSPAPNLEAAGDAKQRIRRVDDVREGRTCGRCSTTHADRSLKARKPAKQHQFRAPRVEFRLLQRIDREGIGLEGVHLRITLACDRSFLRSSVRLLRDLLRRLVPRFRRALRAILIAHDNRAPSGQDNGMTR